MSAGGAAHQARMVHGPEVALPEFGRRAGDVRPLRRAAILVRRLIDLVVAATAVIIVTPLMVAIAGAVKATSPGPVLFKQERVGRDGRLFEILKFRTMNDGTHHEVRGTDDERERYVANNFKLDPDDPRITPLGRLLRRTSLDELPQLFNILSGDMSVVGIRPLLPEELALRSEIDQRLYCRLRPGLTGLWQVSGRSKIQHNQRIALDRCYAAEWRIRTDLLIIVRTLITVLRTDQVA